MSGDGSSLPRPEQRGEEGREQTIRARDRATLCPCPQGQGDPSQKRGKHTSFDIGFVQNYPPVTVTARLDRSVTPTN